MALRNIIIIDEEKCNGCGLCAKACAEGAIQIIGQKAKLVSETYCDGLGACIGHCPQDAITIEQKEAMPFSRKGHLTADAVATEKHLSEMKKEPIESSFVCPGVVPVKLPEKNVDSSSAAGDVASQLTQWPIQLKLVSPHAPYFADANLLLVADCVPFAAGDFHSRFLRGHSIVVGCPKLDDARFYIEKLADIFRLNKLKSLTVVHMEVPCCHGLTNIASEALKQAGIEMPFEDITIDLNGSVGRIEKFPARRQG